MEQYSKEDMGRIEAVSIATKAVEKYEKGEKLDEREEFLISLMGVFGIREKVSDENNAKDYLGQRLYKKFIELKEK